MHLVDTCQCLYLRLTVSVTHIHIQTDRQIQLLKSKMPLWFLLLQYTCARTHIHTNKCKVITASRQTKRGLFCLEWPSSETVSRSHCLCHWGMFGAESVHCFYQSFSRTSLIEKECTILWEKGSKQKGEQMKQRQQMFGACWRRDRRVLSNFKHWGEVFLTGCNTNNGVRLFISLILLGLLGFF